jgi:hypothetical protein
MLIRSALCVLLACFVCSAFADVYQEVARAESNTATSKAQADEAEFQNKIYLHLSRFSKAHLGADVVGRLEPIPWIIGDGGYGFRLQNGKACTAMINWSANKENELIRYFDIECAQSGQISDPRRTIRLL